MQVKLIDFKTLEQIDVPLSWLPDVAESLAVLPESTPLLVCDLDPRHMRVDHEYQRALQHKRVLEYAAAWDDRLAFALTVSHRGNHDYVVIDGQHRLAAALEAHRATVPCLVLTGLTRQQEAALYVVLNTKKRTPSPRDRFKARLVAGDRIAADIAQVVANCGYGLELANVKRARVDMITAVATLEHIYRRGMTLRHKGPHQGAVTPEEGVAAITRALSTIRDAWPHQRDATSHDILLGVHLFWVYHAEDLSRDGLVSKLRYTTATQLTRDAMARRAAMGGSRPLWVAHELRAHYNKSKKQGRIPQRMPLPGSSEDREETGMAVIYERA